MILRLPFFIFLQTMLVGKKTHSHKGRELDFTMSMWKIDYLSFFTIHVYNIGIYVKQNKLITADKLSYTS